MTTKPTKQDLFAAVEKTISDVIAPDLKVLFCGINPGLYSGATGHHFARPGNRFWKTLYAAGFSERLLAPHEQNELLKNGYGITNICERTTARADELSNEEIKAGGAKLRAKVLQFQPKFLAVLGITTYRIAFDSPKAVLGLQTEQIGETRIWVLPNPSGLNAHYQAGDLAKLFRELRETVESEK
ncbi:MAG: G/U mismatch-specific DNA glycosylase [Acidobacteriota bacterium]|nr:G/U mismatch-specific DNA glycosylase [Acidobacteriota bacterium]